MSDFDPTNPANRPKTPPTTMWFEFILDNTLLEKHLTQTNPDPTPGDLIALFLYQADIAAATAREIREGSQVIDIEDDQLTENRKIRALKLLALKVAAFLKWDLNALDKGVPLAMVQDILLELLRLTLKHEQAEPNKHKMLNFKQLPGQALFAIQLYHRWCLKTVIQSCFPVKQPKVQNVQVPGLLDPNAATASAKETVLQVVREGMEDSTVVLSQLSELGRGVIMPTLTSIGTHHSNRDASHDWTKCVEVPESEMLCQVCYDLGAVYFLQQKYPEAFAMFGKADELYSQLGDCVFCSVDSDMLAGYIAACSGMQGQLLDSGNLLERIEAAKANGYSNVVQLLLEDHAKCELSLSYRLSIEQDIKKMKPDSQEYHQVALANGIRRALDGRTMSCDLIPLLQSKPENTYSLLNMCKDTVSGQPATKKTSIEQLIRYLCHALPKRHTFVAQLFQHPLAAMLFDNTNAERETFSQLQRDSATPPLLTVESEVIEKGVDKQSQQHLLERQLLTAYNPTTIKDLINRLSNKMGKQQLQQLKYLSDKWRISRDLAHAIDVLPIPWVRIFTHILVSKARLCHQMQLHEKARELLTVANNTTKDISYKLARILPWEILRLDLQQFNTKSTFCDEQSLAELKKRTKACFTALEGKHGASGKHDIRPYEEVISSCVVFLINIQDWESLISMFNIRNGYIETGRLISLLCKELPNGKNARKAARELWEAMVLVFTGSNAQKRNNSGGMMPREANQGPLTRQQLAEMIDKITEPTVLSTLISLLARLYAALKDDISVEITTDYLTLWPTTISSPASVNVPAVEDMISTTLQRALILNPCQPSWLHTKGDLCFVTSQYSQALKHYLELGILATDYFYDQVNKNVYDEQLYKRLIKCCMNLHCYTQAAVLCQCLDEVDYATAFKAFQERICHDSMDTYYRYIWDVTLLEYLINIHTKRGEHDKRQVAMKAIGQPELNGNNPPEILFEAARTRKACFFRAMARQYV